MTQLWQILRQFAISQSEALRETFGSRCRDQAKPGTAWFRKAKRCAIELNRSKIPKEREVKTVGLIVVSSDRDLCSGYNTIDNIGNY